MGERGIPALIPLHQTHSTQKTSAGHWTQHSSTHPPVPYGAEWKRGRDERRRIKSRGRQDETEIKAERSAHLRGLAPSARQPHLHGTVRPLPQPWEEWKWRRRYVRVASGSLCGEWSATAGGCICSAWTNPQLPSVWLFIEMKWKRQRERERWNKISTEASSLPHPSSMQDNYFLLSDSVAL